MTNVTPCQSSISRLPIAWVLPGPLRQVTGGYLYDARIVDGLRASGWPVGVLDLRAERWPVDLAAGRRLRAALRARHWGAMVIDELAHPAVAAAMLGGDLARDSRRAPLVLLVHHLRCSEPGRRSTRLVARVVERLVLRAADLIVCTSATTAETVRAMTRPATPVEVVRPGWDTHESGVRSQESGVGRDDLHAQPLSQGEGRKGAAPLHRNGEGVGGDDVGLQGSPWSVTDGWQERSASTLRVLMVAHWTPRKSILDALQAVHRAPDRVTLDLVGETDRDPGYAARVRRALRAPGLAERVRVHGRVSSDHLAELYRAADALLLCSSHEGYGMVLAEGVAAGLPVVATRVGAVPEVVRDGHEAELVEPGDVAGLARALDRLAQDASERQRRASLARERATRLPTWKQSVAAFDELLRRLTRVG